MSYLGIFIGVAIVYFVAKFFAHAKLIADPLAEAEVYLAYGRSEQAVKVLEDGFRKFPERSDIREKLDELRSGF
ncbi:type IV pilus assembly protein FimV [Hydrogenophaga soli]